MQITKHSKPQPPLELQVLSHLSSRMHLPASSRTNLRNLKKGYQGERTFYQLLEKNLTSKCIPLFDLYLEYNQTEFQIDNLLIFQNTIFMNEIKNYENDFLIKDTDWYAIPTRKEIRNPLLQLKRSEFLLRQLLLQIGFPLQIEANIVFVNPEFMLYQAPYNEPLIFPTQLNRYIHKLNSIPSKPTTQTRKLAGKLVSYHKSEYSRMRLPEYQYDQLKKGIICPSCRGLLNKFSRVNLQCTRCGNKESIDSATKRSIIEFHLLFPVRPITISAIYEWCGMVVSKYVIRKILSHNLSQISRGRSTHYIYESFL